MTIAERIAANRAKLIAEGREFKSTFGIPLTKFFDPFLGFDAVKFDAWSGCPEDTSLAEYIHRNYGVDGLALIIRILKEV